MITKHVTIINDGYANLPARTLDKLRLQGYEMLESGLIRWVLEHKSKTKKVVVTVLDTGEIRLAYFHKFNNPLTLIKGLLG